MGMSGDFETAIEEGATIVRIGTAIFGPRPSRGAAMTVGKRRTQLHMATRLSLIISGSEGIDCAAPQPIRIAAQAQATASTTSSVR